MTYQYKANHTSYVLYYHLVFVTMKTFPTIDQPLARFLEEFFSFKCKDLSVKLIAQKVLSAHVHLLLSLRPTHYLPEVIIGLKQTASHEANHHHKFTNRLDWMRGHHINTVSQDDLNIAITYIRNQFKWHPDQVPLPHTQRKTELYWKLDEQHKPNDTQRNLYYHVVWTTAKREAMINLQMANNLKNCFSSKCKEIEVELLEKEVLSEHVHLSLCGGLTSYLPSITNSLKGASSYKVNTALSWARGYHVNTISKQHLNAVNTYIQKQYEHHPDKIPQTAPN